MPGVIHIKRAGDLKALCGVICTRRWGGPSMATCQNCLRTWEARKGFQKPTIDAAEVVRRAEETRERGPAA